MTIKGKLVAKTASAGAAALEGAALRSKSFAANAVESYSGLRRVIEGSDGPVGPDVVLAGLVAAVRRDEVESDRSSRDVYRITRARRRKLGLISFGAGPLRGVASQVVDLYCDTAALFDVAALHSVSLSDKDAAAHMLVVWGVLPDSHEAFAVLTGADGRNLSQVLLERASGTGTMIGGGLSDKRSAIEALFKARSLLAAGKVAAGSGNVKDVVFAGHHAKQVIRRSERQLGVS
ncbi:MAG TPA: hypothetical protein VH061_08455 [Solirubrobacteraceae bacterium]|jgi:hypothetical protein|nr:hypothetical protein [Solirubrobacteraceae bacterium]